jgi:tetratricopeptide (TPR) repeat protein
MAIAMIISGVTAPLCSARRIAAGDDFPAITATSIAGQSYERQSGSGRAAMIAFLAAEQKPSQQAAKDIQRIVSSYTQYHQQMDVMVVLDDSRLQKEFEASNENYHILQDAEKQLWGQFHIIVAPTVIIADKSDKVTSVIAGHGYDFAQSLRFQLNQVLGIAQQITAGEVGKVKTVQNNTESAKIQRHLKMAKMLEDKGKIDAALQQIQQAQALTPDDPKLVLEVARLNCLRNKPDLALKALEGQTFTAAKDAAAMELITGWAKRLLGDLDAAKDHLLKATQTTDPSSARAFFELGQVYEATDQKDLALKAYKNALVIALD